MQAASDAASGSDPLAFWALVVAILAAGFTGWQAFVAQRTHDESKTVWLHLEASTERYEVPSQSFFPSPTDPPSFETRPVWMLHNSGAATIMNPSIRVEQPGESEVLYFQGQGPLPGRGKVQVVPIGDYHWTDAGFWYGRSAVVDWTDSKGKTHSTPATVAYSYV